MTGNGMYLLAVVAADREPSALTVAFDPPLTFRPVREGGLSALAAATDCADWTLDRGERLAAHLHAHRDALLRLATEGAFVPFPYGTVAGSESDVRTLLATRSTLFDSLLRKLDGCDAFEVDARFEHEHVLRGAVDADPGFAALVGRAMAGGPDAADARHGVEERIGAWLRTEGPRLAAACLPELLEHARDVRHRPPRTPETALCCLFLVPRDRRTQFLEALDKLAERLPRGVTLSCVGPVPPLAFAEARLRPLWPAEVAAARDLLALGGSATLAELHTAYLSAAARAHPDTGGTAEHFRQVNEAYRLLRACAAIAGTGDDTPLPLAVGRQGRLAFAWLEDGPPTEARYAAAGRTAAREVSP